jgi:hypothetical protein
MLIAIWFTFAALAVPPATADVKITHSHLVATCVNGAEPPARKRSWKLSAPASFVFTMRNEPRPGVGNATAGYAAIAFAPEAGHHYEIEVRGPADAYSRRVWKQGEWTPVVRDRITDRIVSSEPRWVEKGCGD